MKTKFFYLACLLLIQVWAKAQVKIGNNSTTINSASLLELETTNQGFVLPRVSISDVSTSLPLPAGLLTGTVVYNTNSSTTGGSGVGIYYWDGAKWNFMANTSITANYWSLTGNSGTNASTNFIGTTDAIDFVARTANTERMRILGAASGSSKAGWIGMGVTIPRSSLDVTGHYTNKNVVTIENSSTSGYSSVDMLDSAGNLAATFGYANLGTSASFSGKAYFNGYGNDFLFTRGSSYDWIMKGSNGYVGLNTNAPSERLHVVGNIYLNGAFMPGGDPGTSGYILTSAGANTSPLWKSLSGLSWSLTGNSGTSYATNFLGTTDNISMRFRTNNVQRMIIDSLGRVGIGLSNPSYALSVLSSSNPLYLSGLQATGTFSSDSLLTINGGVVKKTPYSSLTNNFWSLTGNSGTNYATNFLGTADNVSLRFRTNNTERMIIDSLGSVGIGSTNFDPIDKEKLLVDYGVTTSDNVATFRGSVADFMQLEVQNYSNSTVASSDFVATNDIGTDSTNYIDMGINSSTYAPSVENFGGPNDGYLYTYSRNLLIGAEAPNSDVIFLLGGGRIRPNTVLRLKGEDGNVVVGAGEASTTPVGNTLRGPNAINSAINTAGGSLTLAGGSSTGTAAGGDLNITGGTTAGAGIGGNVNITGGGTTGGTLGVININASTNSVTNINTGTSTGTVTLGNSSNNINLPKLSATSVVLTDASKNLTSTTPSANTYLYYNGANFTWAAAATLSSFSATLPLTYNNLTGVFAINKATTLADGYLSSADWNTFNNKVGSITLNTPSSVFSNPITFSVSSGAATGTLSLNTQAAGTVFAGPVNVASGTPAAVPTFRALVAADIPSLGGIYIQNQTTLQASSNFNISGNGTIGTNLTVTGKSTLTGVTNTGTLTTSGGDVNMNINSNNSTNINTGTSTSNVTIGNSSNNILLPKFNIAGGMIYTIAATGQIAGTGSNMIWDNTNSRLGIGTASPSNKLSVLAANDPLYLSGVQATAAFTTDSVLTIYNGVVKKAPYSSLPVAANAWLQLGNSGTTPGTNFIGTTDAKDLVFKVGGTQAGYLGYSSGSSAPYSTAFGLSSSATNYATAIGASANAVFQSTAIGYNAQATGANSSIAVGYNSAASTQNSIAIGAGAIANTGNDAIAIGTGANANYTGAIAIGASSKASNGVSKNYAVAIGVSSNVTSYLGIALGNGAAASTNDEAMALGVSTTASGSQSTAIGNSASATAQNSTAIGNGANTSQTNALVLGNSSTNVGIGTSTPNTTTKLDVAGSFKLGTAGSVLGSVIKSSVTISPTVNLGTTTTYTATVTGATINGSVILNPRTALASGVVIAYSYVSSVNTITIGLTSGSTTGALGSLTFDVTIMQ